MVVQLCANTIMLVSVPAHINIRTPHRQTSVSTCTDMINTYQLHDGGGPRGQQLDTLVSHVHQFFGCLVIVRKVAAGDDLQKGERKGGERREGKEGRE